MTIMPSLTRNIRGIFRIEGHFIQVGVYKLSTLSNSYAGRYPEGTTSPSGLQVTFEFLSRPSGASEDLRPIPQTFGCFRGSSSDSADLRVPTRTFGFLTPSAVFSLAQACLVLPPCIFGQPLTCEMVIPNSSPSQARADSDGLNPRSIYHLQPRKRLPQSEVGTSRR